MQVLYHPPWGNGDYQNFLYTALEKRGVEIEESINHPIIPIFASSHRIRKADIFHIHWVHTLYGGTSLKMPLFIPFLLIQLIYLRIIDVTVVWTVHNLKTHDTRYPRLDRLVRHIIAHFICSAMIVHCEKAQELVQKEYRLPETSTSKIYTIPHGNYEPYPCDTTDPSPLDVNIPKGGICYLHFGSIKPYKGTLELIECFKSVARENDHLLIAGQRGDEEYIDGLKVAADDHRIDLYLNYIENSEFCYFANEADVMVLPYREILTSGAAHLALSFNLPVIAPRIGCLPETVPEEAGILYTPGQLSTALEEIRSIDFDTSAIKSEEVMREKSWDTVAEKTDGIYREFVK